MASFEIIIPPSTLCSAAMSCGGVRSKSRDRPDPDGMPYSSSSIVTDPSPPRPDPTEHTFYREGPTPLRDRAPSEVRRPADVDTADALDSTPTTPPCTPTRG